MWHKCIATEMVENKEKLYVLCVMRGNVEKENGKLRCLNDSLTKQLKQKHGKLESALISVVWCILISLKCFYWYFSILNETAILSPHPSYLFTFSLHQFITIHSGISFSEWCDTALKSGQNKIFHKAENWSLLPFKMTFTSGVTPTTPSDTR